MKNEWLLVLGANSDMALATAHQFAKKGWSIYLASRQMEELKKEVANIELRYGVVTKALYFDALDFSSHETFYAGLLPKPGGAVLAFGLLGEQESSQENFEIAKKVIDTNYLAAVSILEIIAADYEKQKSGFIVGISSVAGDRGRASNYIYGSSKAGFTAYLSGLRHRLFKIGVHVVTVKPGFVATKMTQDMDLPKALTAQPQEVAAAIYNAVLKKRNTIYIKPVWRLIMIIIANVPEFMFKKSNL